MTAVIVGRREGVVRVALSDLYFHSAGLVGLNLLWGLGLTFVAMAALLASPIALVLVPLLAVPAVGTARLAARIVREDPDRSIVAALLPGRVLFGGTVLAGVGVLIAGVVLTSNAVIGLTAADPFAWLLGTLAAWGLVILWAVLLVAIPLLVDPWRAERPVGERLRLATAVLVANPRRCAWLGVTATVFLAISTVLVVVLLSTSLAITALAASRIVLPLADRLDGTTGKRS
ncbi:MAG: hypothetical protein ACSLFN_03255 [Candidatus Limnocylindrales bacterium]